MIKKASLNFDHENEFLFLGCLYSLQDLINKAEKKIFLDIIEENIQAFKISILHSSEFETNGLICQKTSISPKIKVHFQENLFSLLKFKLVSLIKVTIYLV